MNRVCLDTNVLIAAFISRGLCSDLFRLVLSEYELVVPERVLEEVVRVLRVKFKAPPDRIARVQELLEGTELLPKTDHSPPVAVEDPDDARIFADAVAGGAQILVSGDPHLLKVASESPIPILSPRAFMVLARGGAR